MYVLDTNIITELMKPQPDRHVVAWVDARDNESLFLSAITIGELMRGVAKLPVALVARRLRQSSMMR